MAHYKGAASEAGRAMHLMKKREKAQMEIEFRKKKLEEDLKISNMENKFAAHYDAVEQQLKSSTIGLVTLDEMKAKQENIVKEREKKLAQKQLEKEQERQRQLEAKQAEKNRQKQQLLYRYRPSRSPWIKMKMKKRMKMMQGEEVQVK
uniref:Protein FAM50 homolog n=1 Tax=Cacopsylla melanoneura TaxID=428564 RepID=A0A8D8S5H2_9HEMI